MITQIQINDFFDKFKYKKIKKNKLEKSDNMKLPGNILDFCHKFNIEYLPYLWDIQCSSENANDKLFYNYQDYFPIFVLDEIFCLAINCNKTSDKYNTLGVLYILDDDNSEVELYNCSLDIFLKIDKENINEFQKITSDYLFLDMVYRLYHPNNTYDEIDDFIRDDLCQEDILKF